MRSSIVIAVFITLLVQVAASRLSAQWVKIASNVVTPYPTGYGNNEYGAIHYKAGLLWVGWLNDLWSSADSGKTWQKNSLSAGIIDDINFFDAQNGLVSTFNAGVFLTRNGGASWKRIFNDNCTNVAFDGSPNVLHIVTVGAAPPPPTGLVHTSVNGGATWTDVWPGGEFCQPLCIAIDGTIYTVCSANQAAGLPGFVSFSTDKGLTWHQQAAEVDGDSFTLSADSCDAKILYVANDDYLATFNNQSDLYYSWDAGTSWNDGASFSFRYLSGAMTTTFNAAYATSLDSGIFRTTDHGATWKNIGGGSDSIPSAFDSRNITAIDDNTLFVLDANGNIWETINSGGDSVLKPPSFVKLSRDTLFNGRIYSPCDSLQSQFISFTRTGCPLPRITAMNFVGSGTGAYQAFPVVADSFKVTFNPLTLGLNDAQLILTLSNGKFDTVYLKGDVAKIPYKIAFVPDTLFKLDSAFTCDSVPGRVINLSATGCPLPVVVSKQITGANATSFDLLYAPDTLHGTDNIVITLKPLVTGKLNAEVVLTLNDGSVLSIPISGYGIPSLPLTLSTQNVTSDTVGGTVRVPIGIAGLQKPEAVSLIVHYDTLLTYEGSYSTANTALDLPGEQWKGRSKILIPNATPSGISAYSVFDVFNDTLDTQRVWFDSVIVASAVPPCRYVVSTTLPLTSSVTPLTGCGTVILSQYLHYGHIPQFDLMPNPTSGNVQITSSESLAGASVIIYDMLGIERGRSVFIFEKNIPLRLALPMANGIYTIRITAGGGVYEVRAVVSR